MNVLGIETSCDETSAAVVSDGFNVRSSVVFSQAHLHSPYGGVVPEIASRNHVASLPGVIEQAVLRSGLSWNELDAVAVTHGPGLASSLLVGISAAKALALRLKRVLICVNHLEAHLYSPFLGHPSVSMEDVCPFLALIVSGGHTCLLRVECLGDYQLLGETRDDAAGEAFDKGAKILGLEYPGGPAIDRECRSGDANAVLFPRGRAGKNSRSGVFQEDLCFSFSGVKTALLYHVKSLHGNSMARCLPDLAASYQEAIVDALLGRTRLALSRERLHCLAVGGGVSLNSRLRERMKALADSMDCRLLLAEPGFCVDNAAMVAGLAGAGGGVWGEPAWLLDACPNLGIGVGDIPAPCDSRYGQNR